MEDKMALLLRERFFSPRAHIDVVLDFEEPGLEINIRKN